MDPDNFLIRLNGENLSQRTCFDALEKIKDEALWENDRLWEEVAESLPNYRLSRFQSLMPEWVQREVVSTYLLNIEGARRWLMSSASNGMGACTGDADQ